MSRGSGSNKKHATKKTKLLQRIHRMYATNVSKGDTLLEKFVYRYIRIRTEHSQWSDDIKQETFLRACPKMREEKEATYEFAWLQRIANNYAIDITRRIARRKQTEQHNDEEYYASKQDDLLEVIVRSELLLSALEYLEMKRERSTPHEVLYQSAVKEREDHDIASDIGCHGYKIRQLRHTARKEMRTIFVDFNEY